MTCSERNCAYVRQLLRKRQPGFALALEEVVASFEPPEPEQCFALTAYAEGMERIERLLEAASLGLPRGYRLRRWRSDIRRTVGRDTLPEAIRQARAGVEECFMSDTEQYDTETGAAICRALDDAVENLTTALRLATEEEQ